MATLTSITLSVNSNPINWQSNTGFQVIAVYDNNTTRDVTDSCSYTLNPEGIVTISGIELWVGTDIWTGTEEW